MSGVSVLLQRIWRLFYGKLARASAWLFAGSLAGGLLGYVFHVVMGRMLSTDEYGLFTAMMAVFTVAAAPLGTLMMLVARKVSEYRARQADSNITDFHRSIHFRSALVGGIACAVACVAAEPARIYLKSPTIGGVYLLWLLLFVSVFPVLNTAFLQGLQKFAWLSASNSMSFLLKIAFAAVLVWMGYGVSGAIVGATLAAMATWLFAYIALREPLSIRGCEASARAHLTIRPAVPVLAANAAFAAMTQLDMVLVNHYFAAHEAGLYAAASILGKAVMYLPGGIALALFPMVAEGHARDEATSSLLIQAVVLTSLLCLGGALFYLALGEPLIVWLYGEKYRDAAPVLQYFGFAMLPMALVTVAEYFLIARGRVLFAYLFFVVAPLQLFAIHLWHGTLVTVVAIIGASGLALALIGYALLWRALAPALRT